MSLPQRRREQQHQQLPRAPFPYPQHSSFQSDSVPISIPPESLNLDLTSSEISYEHARGRLPQRQNGDEEEQDHEDSSRIDYTISKPLTKAQQQMRYGAGYPDVRDQIGMIDEVDTRRNIASSSSRPAVDHQTHTSNRPSQFDHQQQQQLEEDSYFDDDDDSTVHEEPSYHPGVARASRMNSLSNNLNHHSRHQLTNASLLNGGTGQSSRSSSQAFASTCERLGEKPQDRYASSSRLLGGQGGGKQTSTPAARQQTTRLDLQQSDSDHFGGSTDGAAGNRQDSKAFNRIRSDPARANGAVRNSFQVNRPSPLNHSSKPNTSSNESQPSKSFNSSLKANPHTNHSSTIPRRNSNLNQPSPNDLFARQKSSSSSNFDSQSDSHTSSSSSDDYDEEDGHYYNGGHLKRPNSTGVHSALAATPRASVRSSSPEKDRARSRPSSRSNKRPAFRNHEVTLDFNKTEELIEKLEGKTQRSEHQGKDREVFDFPRSSSNINLKPTFTVRPSPSIQNSGSFTNVMKSVRKDLPGPTADAKEDADADEEDGEGASNANSNESGFAPGSQHSSNKTKVGSPSPPPQQSEHLQQSDFGINHFKNYHHDDSEKQQYETLYLPSGVSMGNGRPIKGGKVNLPDMSGISSCLGSPVKERLGVKHRKIDENVGRTLNTKLASAESNQHQREGPSSDETTIDTDPIESRANSVSTTLSNRAKEFKDLIKILNGFRDQLEDTGLRVDELEEFKASWEDKLNEFGVEIEGWFEDRLKELGLNEKEKVNTVAQSDHLTEQVAYPSETEQDQDDEADGDETFTAAKQHQHQQQHPDQSQNREEMLLLRNNVLKLKSDLEEQLHLLKDLEEEKKAQSEENRQRSQARSNAQSSRRSDGRRANHASVAEGEEDEDDADNEGQNGESTRQKLTQIQSQMETFERELRNLNRVVYDEIVVRESKHAPSGTRHQKSQARNPAKPGFSKPKSGFQKEQNVHEPHSDHSQSELDLGEINPAEMDKVFVRPGSSASAAKIAAALGSKKRLRHIENPSDPPSSPFRRSTGSVSISDTSSSRDDYDDKDGFMTHRNSEKSGRRRVASYEEMRHPYHDGEDGDDTDTTRSNSHVGPGRENLIRQFNNARAFRNPTISASDYIQSSPTKPSRAKKPHVTNSREQQRSRASSRDQARSQLRNHAGVSNTISMTPPQSPDLNLQEGNLQYQSHSEREADDDDEDDGEFFDDQDLTREIVSRVERAEATTQKSLKERKARETQHLSHLDVKHSKKSCSVCSQEVKNQKKRKARKERIREFERNKRIEDEEEEGILNLLSLKEQEDEERSSQQADGQHRHSNKQAHSHSSRWRMKLNSSQVDLLKRIIDEHLDEFLHQRELYSQLADDFKKIDPQMPAIKRRIFASHLLDSVESLEFKANRINQLQELLEDSFDDDGDVEVADEQPEEEAESEDDFAFSDQASDRGEINLGSKSKAPPKSKSSGKAFGKQRARDGRDISALRNSPPMNDISGPLYNQKSGRIRSAIV